MRLDPAAHTRLMALAAADMPGWKVGEQLGATPAPEMVDPAQVRKAVVATSTVLAVGATVVPATEHMVGQQGDTPVRYNTVAVTPQVQQPLPDVRRVSSVSPAQLITPAASSDTLASGVRFAQPRLEQTTVITPIVEQPRSPVQASASLGQQVETVLPKLDATGSAAKPKTVTVSYTAQAPAADMLGVRFVQPSLPNAPQVVAAYAAPKLTSVLPDTAGQRVVPQQVQKDEAPKATTLPASFRSPSEIRADLRSSYPDGVSGKLTDRELVTLPASFSATKGEVHRMTPEAAVAFLALAELYNGDTGKRLLLNESYRSYDDQVAIRARLPGLAAVPGTSEHGWGLAVDVKNSRGAQYRWMREHDECGIVNPDWALPGGSGPTEPWHWEFLGEPKGRCIPVIRSMLPTYMPKITGEKETVKPATPTAPTPTEVVTPSVIGARFVQPRLVGPESEITTVLPVIAAVAPAAPETAIKFAPPAVTSPGVPVPSPSPSPESQKPEVTESKPESKKSPELLLSVEQMQKLFPNADPDVLAKEWPLQYKAYVMLGVAKDPRWVAYCLATKMIENPWFRSSQDEIGGEAYLRSKRYYPYYGRGRTQLTWRENYAHYTRRLQREFGMDVDLVKNPELMNDPWIDSLVGAMFVQEQLRTVKKAVNSGNFQKAREEYNGRGTTTADEVAEYYAMVMHLINS